MKPLNYKISLLLLALFVSFVVSAQEKQQKQYKESYDVSKTDQLIVDNKFGKVEITNTTNNKIDIVVTVITEKEGKAAEKFFESVKIEISKSGNTIKAVTNMEDLKIKNGKGFEINYAINMPSYLNTELQNSFGEVIIEELTGKSNIQVNYGSLIAQRIIDGEEKPLSTITLKYCDNSSIKEVNWAKIALSYSELNLAKGNAIMLYAKYSEAELGKVRSVASECAYSDLEIRDVEKLKLKNRYTDVEIDYLRAKLDIDNAYGDVEVEHVTNTLESIKIDNAYGDMSIEFDGNTLYKLDAQVTYADINYPKIEFTKKIKEGSSMELQGANSPNATAEVYIRSRYGDVSLSTN